VVPHTVGQQVPECREHDSSNQRFEEWHPEEDGITRNDEDHHIGHDPDSHQRGNDRPNDAEWEPPAYNKFCYKADNDRNEQIHELTLIESQMEIAYVDRDEWYLTQECEHNVPLLLSVYACFLQKAHGSEKHNPFFFSTRPISLFRFNDPQDVYSAANV
jgi:hypothetical protein